MVTTFLLEIGIEELPAIPFLKELPNIKEKFSACAKELHIAIGDFALYYTPRRLVISSSSFAINQDDVITELFGPPLESAFKDSLPTPAALGFAKKCGVDVAQLGKSEKNGKEVLYFQNTAQGKATKELVPELVKNFLASLNFGKTMRWGALKEEFIRPVRWCIANLNNEFLSFELYGIRSSDFTYANRSHSDDAIKVDSVAHYFETLKNGFVLIDPKEREARILEHFKDLESKNGIKIELDSELLDEVVAITEYPTPLLGSFEARFLSVPPEMIITSMKEHQRYFGVWRGETLANNFVVVSNALAQDFTQVIKGNEKVLRARLSDALFFYENDIKNGFRLEALENVTFAEGLGSLAQKAKREESIALELFARYKKNLLEESKLDEGTLKSLLSRACELAKGDLMSESVYEFTELQGIMGYYFAQAFNEHPSIALALKEQYLPKGEESELPSNLFSAVLALALRLDNIFALFSIDKIPSGSKDPFALRRSALGIIRIVLAYDLPFDIASLTEAFASHYAKVDKSTIAQFFYERLYSLIECNPSIIKAVINSGETDITKCYKKIHALKNTLANIDNAPLFATFKRVANITKDVDISKALPVDSTFFESGFEEALYTSFSKIALENEQYETTLKELFALKNELDKFFDNVLVNCENEAVRENRKNLIAAIYKAFLRIAELKEITA